MALTVKVNGEAHELDIEGDTPLLWAIRDHLQLTGTKFGCGMAQCGACTVHVNGKAVRSCVTPVSSVDGLDVTTIEGLSSKEAKAVQQAWDKLDVVQCGYCQSGQIMSATALLGEQKTPSDNDIDQFMSGNICRCSTYVRIKAAIKQAATDLATEV